MLIDGRCTEMKFSSWIKSHWDKDRYMLMECQFSKRGDKLTVGEWKKVLEEMMLMFRDDHYHTREGGLTEDFENTITALSDRLCAKMRLGSDTTRVEEEEVTLIDLTPRNSLDAVLVAEAIMGGRSPITILDVEEVGSISKLRGALRVIKGNEDDEEIDVGMKVGYTEIKELCKQKEMG